MLNDNPVQWVHKLKYLGCFFNQSSFVDYCNSMQKYCGNFNNILALLGHKRDEISAVHLVKSYCVPSLLYGCEIWTLNTVFFYPVHT